MKHLDKKAVYGDIPKEFTENLKAALRTEPVAEPRFTKLTPAVVLSICLIVVSTVALAIVQVAGLLDVFGIGITNQEEARKYIKTNVSQTGGETSVGTFTIDEVHYDGKFLRFSLVAEPEENASFVFTQAQDSLITDQSENKYAVNVAASIDGSDIEPVVFHANTNDTHRSYVYASLGKGLDRDLSINVGIDILEFESGNKVDNTTVSFTASQISAPDFNEYSTGLFADVVNISSIKLTGTPFETLLTIEFQPFLKKFSGFTALPDDGYIVKDGESYYFGSIGSIWDINKEGVGVLEYILPAETYQKEKLAIWVTGTDKVLLLNAVTGETSIATAVLEKDNQNILVEIKEGN